MSDESDSGEYDGVVIQTPEQIAKRAATEANAVKSADAVPATEVPVAVVKKPKYFLSVDIERVGGAFKYGILAIGVCFGTSDNVVLDSRAFCSRVPDPSGFEPRCYKFWSEFPDVLARIDTEAAASADQRAPALQFASWLADIEQRYGPFGRAHQSERELRLVSDNPAYDLGVIGQSLSVLVGGEAKPVAEMFSDYVPTDDPTEQVRFATPEQRAAIDAFVTAPHDHYPANDAKEIYQMRCGIEVVLGNK